MEEKKAKTKNEKGMKIGQKDQMTTNLLIVTRLNIYGTQHLFFGSKGCCFVCFFFEKKFVVHHIYYLFTINVGVQ